MNGDTLNGDSDISSTSSQTSSEHDPSLRTQIQTYNASPSTNWPDESAIYYPNNPTTTNNNNLVTSSISPSVLNILNSAKDTSTNETTSNSTAKNFDQLPEYKLFSSNGPSIHSILFGNNEHSQQSHRPLINGIDHDIREIEKRLMGKRIISFVYKRFFFVLDNCLDNTSYSQTQENDELGKLKLVISKLLVGFLF